MENLSPLLQAQIAQQQSTNNQNQANQTYIDLSSKPDSVELSTKQSTDKNKIIKIAAVAAFIAAVAGIIIQLKRHKPVQNTVQVVKNFIDKDGAKVEGVKLEKGKAILEDGSAFSGIMETATKKGKKVAIEYQDGFMTKSTINDKLYKTYGSLSETIPRTKNVLISWYNDIGKVIKENLQFFHDNGKISKSMIQDVSINDTGDIVKGNYKVLEFSPNGKIIGDYTANPLYTSKSGKLFNEDGTIKQIINE